MQVKFNYIFGTVDRKKIPAGSLVFVAKQEPVRRDNDLTRFTNLGRELSNMPLLCMPKEWGTPKFNQKLHDDVVDAMRYVVKNQSDKIKEKKVDIKAELHKLVDGADPQLLLSNHEVFKISHYELMTSGLKFCQQPKELSLEAKLENAGFNMVEDGKICTRFVRGKITVFISRTQGTVKTVYAAGDYEDTLRSKYTDLKKVFADIGYLEHKHRS